MSSFAFREGENAFKLYGFSAENPYDWTQNGEFAEQWDSGFESASKKHKKDSKKKRVNSKRAWLEDEDDGYY